MEYENLRSPVYFSMFTTLIYRDPYLDFNNGKYLQFTGDSELIFDLTTFDAINKLGNEIEMK